MTRHRISSSASLPVSPDEAPTRAFLLGRQTPEQSSAEVASSLSELARLLEGLGIVVAGSLVQRRPSAGAALGKGKLREVAARLQELREPGGGAPLVVVDAALDPGQLRSVQNALQAEIVDRTEVILRVFAARAGTRTAQLEVELAQLTYQAPRVRDEDVGDDRRGGGGRGERGHTNVELRKQRIRERMASIERDLAQLRPLEARQRTRRSDLPSVALVGYTNAGKSSVMRGLTGSEALVQDKLFATLGTTVRALTPSTTPRVLVCDTVGFIRNLPHELITSFRSTLDEARDADLLLFVVDASDPQWREQLDVTRATIQSIGADVPPALILFNKIDRVDVAARSALAREWPDAVLMSARDPADVRRLRERLLAFFDERMIADILEVPATDGRLLADIRAHARIQEETCDEAGAPLQLRLRMRALPEALARWRRVLPGPALETAGDLRKRAREFGLALIEEPGALDRSGLDFLVVHARDVDGVAWVVRTPRRPEVIASAAVEARALRLLRSRLPVAIPDWRLHARDLIAYPRLAGTPAVTVGADGTPTWNIIDPTAPAEVFLDGFAHTLAALQAVSAEEARNAGLPARTLDEVRQSLAQAMDQARDLLAPSDGLWARWQRWLDDDATWPTHVALTHGDLHPGHLLLAPDGRLTGVLDWTEAAVGDPAVDLAMFCGCFGEAALADVIGRFERAGGQTWPALAHHAAERWAAFPALVAAWAVHTGSEAALDHARALMRTNEERTTAGAGA